MTLTMQFGMISINRMEVYSMIKVYYKFNSTTCVKTFENKKEIEEFFEKYKMLKIIKIEQA